MSQRSTPVYLPYLTSKISSSRPQNFSFFPFESISPIMSSKGHSLQNPSNMATRYVHKLLSLFHRQPHKKEDVHSFRTVNGVFGDWTASPMEDVPPPYANDEEYLPPPPFETPCLPICPHETISFEDLRQVVNSLAIKPTNGSINALRTSCHGHSKKPDPATGESKPICISPGLLTGSGTYALVDGEGSSRTSSVVLCFEWDLGLLEGARSQVETAAELQHYLDAESIPLCAHKQMSDPDVIHAIFGFVKRHWSQDQDVVTGCDRCGTEIKVIVRMEEDYQICCVKTKTYLGTMEEPNDPLWLAHCSV